MMSGVPVTTVGSQSTGPAWPELAVLGLRPEDVPDLASSREASDRAIAALRTRCAQLAVSREIGEGCSVLAFGSLARRELTRTSDFDFFVVDPQAATSRASGLAAGTVAELCGLAAIAAFGPEATPLGAPGTTLVFGGLVPESELSNTIGLEDDTNGHMTRRILVLAESLSLHGEEAHRAILQTVVHRYLRERRPGSDKPPRYLINDITRYWRTLSVDFQAKTQSKGNFGVRYLKLLTSRKFLFAATLFPIMFRRPEEWCEIERAESALVAGYMAPPLDRAAAMLERIPDDERQQVAEIVRGIVVALDGFKRLLGDPEWRETVERESRDFDDPRAQPAYSEGMRTAAGVGDGLSRLFFDTTARDFTRAFLVF